MENENWGNPEPKDLTGITLEAMDKMCETAFRMRESIQHDEAILNERKAGLRKLQENVMQVLSEHNKTSYDSEYGKISIMRKLSVKCPKEPEARKEFFDYLKGKGVFEDLVTVHSQTLNAFYKTEWENKKMEGTMEFSMPGIGEPTYYETVQMRKG